MNNLPKSLCIRPMGQTDIEAVIAIETLNSKSPWSENQFQQCLQWTQVLVLDDTVVGFAVVAEMIDQAELQNISLHPDHSGVGLGSELLDTVIERLPAKINQIYLEVRVLNFSAIRLYSKAGFTEIGQRRGYYATEYGREDALLMGYSLC
ncbi:MAG: ribosomal protein S18-alanine N-acetyltransferase [Porticoccaceae bacterium]|nr:ribosomal protein S18-alanine N-acetyltransferase [Porticoccaceae bacterium]